MKENIKVHGQLKGYLSWPLLLSVFMVCANIAAGCVSRIGGLVMIPFTISYPKLLCNEINNAVCIWAYVFTKDTCPITAGMVKIQFLLLAPNQNNNNVNGYPIKNSLLRGRTPSTSFKKLRIPASAALNSAVVLPVRLI